MFRGRKKLQRRDQESGLAFNWRVPVSSTMSFVTALVLVGFVAVGLAAVVRVRIGDPDAEEPSRGVLMIVSDTEGGEWLERRATEAGPFPSRWNPAADPSYAALRRDALRQATDTGIPYRPRLAEIPDGDGAGLGSDTGSPAVLPPLPESGIQSEADAPREVLLGARVLQAESGVELQHAKLALEGAASTGPVGWRFILQYDKDGRVLEVMPRNVRDGQEAVIDWLSRSRVTGNGGKAGWMAVESVIER
ncbi:hypothetical protein HAHE_35060 [Haloferula helveola]|uniref:Uncharacterized protein n=1 Tax=Haloferula helveola TaxID=490095 RepID=A0ABM7RD38_9BACT|nr:hypothetical protein HAHE_35060 [Haloferula helveola]